MFPHSSTLSGSAAGVVAANGADGGVVFAETFSFRYHHESLINCGHRRGLSVVQRGSYGWQTLS